MTNKYKHVFLSYAHENRAEVRHLRDELLAAGEAVWWDQDIRGGDDWKQKIRKAMRESYAIIVCFSKETEARSESGIYPEVLDAIETYRNYTPGGSFLIPVRLSESEIPLVEIDATRTLDRLQIIDLFPPANRADGLQLLVESLRDSPRHP
jgi:hypothetical protein